ncbi:cation-translocating P-type ATPase [Sarcina ventriculi]|uniref:Calcium-transporting ATPase lmo0841 n=1 Tax=Sarcina ventriculi TaxID=1267 RepID=A0ABM9UNU3_SARVE|nr:cation-translocating P-type ATPase [Sarcina ventriculi]MBU5322410.1 cation-translocating P-type ATPase [Sarcina ventriculi]MDD7373535.1 cation-translocating P-type ATPase [Sarcina ventriculi]CUN70073.1 Calcium-transporting ATPase lmo0841 [Sarcina ventriculi]
MIYKKEYKDVISEFKSEKSGLSNAEAKKRLEQNGFNELKGKEGESTLKLILNQFKDPLVIILIIAAIVQIFLKEAVEAIIIIAVVILNAILGVTQTKKAEGSLNSLKKLSSPSAKVLRDGEKIVIPAREIVNGDIVCLESGDYVPADGRVIESQSLKSVEGMLTGESEPVLKVTDVIHEESSLGDQKNMVFSGSTIVYGRGMFIVTATGMNTEVGKIANLLEKAESKETPLQKKLDQFSKRLGIIIMILAIIIFGLEVGRAVFFDRVGFTGELIVNAFMFSISVAVAAIPEALSSIVTIVLASGTNTMAKRKAIIRKLPAVETLGATSIICTDKTGTLTQNKMTVVDNYISKDGEYSFEINIEKAPKNEKYFLLASILCNDSDINEEGKETGDPTEVGLINFAKNNSIDFKKIRDEYRRKGEIPFDSDRKIMSTVNEVDGKTIMFSKGAPDIILSRCKYALVNGEVVDLNENILNEYKAKNEEFSNRALRVLAFAMKEINNESFVPALDDEFDLTLIGLTAMIDPPRESVYDAIKIAKNAGIKTIMITGDHKTTAAAIGKEIGLMDNNDIALTGQELDSMNDIELKNKLENISVYARVSPENKIRIVKAWQEREKITAMTGDGVNDAPALKQADIGIGMGSGTDVAKDAASMILVDDNFATIVKAVEIGRAVFSNIKKSITYLFAGNLGAIISILFAVFVNLPNPFTAIQLLFINLINDSLPAIALGLEPPEKNIMNNKPRNINDGILSGGIGRIVILRGVIIGVVTIIAQYIGLKVSSELGTAMAFSTILLARIFQTIAARSDYYTSIELGFFSNKYVFGAMGVTFIIYLLILLPGVRSILSIPYEFNIEMFFICLGLSILAMIIMEIEKLILRRKH